MNHDKYNIKEKFEPAIWIFCKNLIEQKTGNKLKTIDFDENIWSMTDSVIESMSNTIDDYLETQIPKKD